MKKKIVIFAAVFAIASAALYAYSAGYCLINSCNCHKYVGDSGAHDHCKTCGHERVQHL